ncbi:ATP-binding protein [Tindallia californiensis]|uniref:4Fe-4S binding domain-containing protein n=1 Tax=Tindallia californiensis TaxID=159292 RepID=A0A1H3MWB9_9FIRM|nr:4Fe-4S dicluster domain-containing protein [Tindallia californiensis]SDY81022.1 4Fe-4S binding domain-containing protein [Tindallia californiensis]
MKRKIIQINEELCNGCGDCITACHEGAIEMIDGKARLISDEYCDGLGDCLPECPTGAIEMIQREALPYDEELVMAKIKERENFQKNQQEEPMPCGCPGTMARAIDREKKPTDNQEHFLSQNQNNSSDQRPLSRLAQWPVQMNLIHPEAPYLKNADLLIAADCTAFAYGCFHDDFIKNRITLIGCPKLDDNEYYQSKLTEIFKKNQPRSITVTRMQVPCCAGIVSAVRKAMLEAEMIVPYREVTITTDGNIIE